VVLDPRTRTGYGLSLMAALVWGMTSPVLKYILDTHGVPALTLALWRDLIIAGVLVVGLLVVRPALLRISRAQLPGFALAGAISVGIYHAIWLWSVVLNGAAMAVVLIYLYPIFVSIGAWLFYKEPLRWPHVVALAVALIGCVLMVRLYDPAVFRVSWLGAVVGLLSALTHTVYVLFNQRAMQQGVNPWTSMTYTFLFGALTLLALTAVITPGQVLAVGTTVTPWLLTAFVALVPTLGGYAIFTLALRYIPGKIASLIVIIEVPLAALLAVFVLGERLEPAQIVGMILILTAVVLPRMLGVREEAAPAIHAARADGV
jgi:drug/metabolite transporter, DME family